MPDDIKQTWKNFIKGIRSVLSGLPEYRYQDQFLAVKEAALTLAESEKMVTDLDMTTTNIVLDNPYIGIVFDEMAAFPLAVSVHQAEVEEGVAKPGAKKLLCKSATTILGSFNDVVELSSFAKGVVTVVKEAIELFSSE